MDNNILTEKDLEYLFWDERGKRKKKNPKKQFFVGIISFFAITLIIFFVVNFRSILNNISFWYNNEFQATVPENNDDVKLIVTGTQNKNNPVPNSSLPEIADNSMYIPIINIKAPITWKIANTPPEVVAGLEKGIIHIQGTSMPGEIGNVFITGHSSNYVWAKGNYNNIFSLLNRVVVGDVVQVKYQGINYLYKVSETKVVDPTDISPLENTTDSRLTLMTCTPVGTSLRRLIVVANQVVPDPSVNTTSKSKSNNSSLPGVR